MLVINQTKESEVMVTDTEPELFIITNTDAIHAEDYEYMELNPVYKKELERLGYKFIIKKIEKPLHILSILQIDTIEDFIQLLSNLKQFTKYADNGEVVTVLNKKKEYGYYVLEIYDDIRD